MTQLVKLSMSVVMAVSMVVAVASCAFWFGVRLANAESDIRAVKSEQTAQKDTNLKLMDAMMKMSVNIERIAARLDIQTK